MFQYPEYAFDWRKAKILDTETVDEKDKSGKKVGEGVKVVFRKPFEAYGKKLPRVVLITFLTDPEYFELTKYSFYSLAYPIELLNWVIVDVKGVVNKIDGDKRIRAIPPSKDASRTKSFSRTMDEIFKMSFVDISASGDTDRETVYSFVESGDVMFQDSLVVKYHAMLEKKCDSAVPTSIVQYNDFENKTMLFRYYRHVAMSGIVFRKRWWRGKSSTKTAGVPFYSSHIYIGRRVNKNVFESVHIKPDLFKMYMLLPDKIKEMLKVLEDIRRVDEIVFDDGGDEKEVSTRDVEDWYS